MKKVLAGMIVALLVQGAAAIAAQTTDSVRLGTTAAGDRYLTDSKGMTLYYYTKDQTGDSDCNGNCLKAWPAFYAPDLSVSAPLDQADFGSIVRSDGSSQTTYKGWPLYYWFKDTKPGDMRGEGVGKVWYVLGVPAYTVMIATDPQLGNYLVDGQGRTLYWFTKDSSGGTADSGAPNARWPAFAPSSFGVPSALDPADFATITRGAGVKQATYKGYPLYYFAGDARRGDVKGQGLGGAWYVIDPEKFPVGM